MAKAQTVLKTKNSERLTYLKKDMKVNYSLYLMILPVVLFYLYFHYKPMYGLLISFQDFSFRRGIWGSEWIGFENYARFFKDPYFLRNIVNTFRISVTNLIFGFPAPIILALLVNEVGNMKFKKAVQTITYLPHFISLVVICGMVKDFVATDGIITTFISNITGIDFTESLLNNEHLFVPIFVTATIWREIGWGSIIYLAALSSVDQELYEAATVDGAGRLRQTFAITIPSIIPTIITLFILKVGGILSVGYEKIILLINPYNAETAEILSYYIYKKGIEGGDYSLGTAAGLFNSVINFIFVYSANYISRRVGEVSLW